jgi:signal transduction histidine kinase
MVVISCFVQVLFAQISSIGKTKQSTLDSLKQALSATTNDTLRLVLANELGLRYANNDSSLGYFRQVLDLAHRMGYKIDEAYALDFIGNILMFQYNEHTLQTLFNGMKIAEDPEIERKVLPRKYLEMITYWYPDFNVLLKEHNWAPRYFRQHVLGSLYQDVGHAYGMVMPNGQRLFFYMSKAFELYKSQNDTIGLSLAYENLGEYFYSSNQLDSSLYYLRKADSLRRVHNKLDDEVNALLAAVYFKRGDDSLAVSLARQALQTRTENVEWWDWLSYLTLAEHYLRQSTMDSSLYYATKAHQEATEQNTQSFLQKTSALLANIYSKMGIRDSALKYYQMALALSDTINDVHKKAQLQTQDFEEQRELEDQEQEKARDRFYALLAGLAILSTIALFLVWNNRLRKRANKVLQQKNTTIEHTLQELKATQGQLIQSEKMASLGELTAGIAHEIQNPLNFVNNFSEVNKELLVEMKDEIDKGNIEDAKAIANNVIENQEKINLHGKRADGIVKGMLQHSRASSGQKELTDISKLADEYLRLSYHGMKARDKSFNAEMKTEFDESIGRINVVLQDIGRVLLNLFNNAFYAVNEKQKTEGVGFKTMVSVQTKKLDNKVEIRVADNGNGIPQNIVDKIFQPFFTTKPTGQGTGLGLSLAYDIIKAHGGEIKVESKEGEGSEFIIQLPIV